MAQLKAKGAVIKGFKAVTRAATVVLSVTVALHTGHPGAHDLLVAPVTDAATKWFLDRVLDREWRQQLQRRVAEQRRARFAAFLEAAAVAPVLAGLPPALAPEFAAAARGLMDQLLAGGAEGQDADRDR